MSKFKIPLRWPPLRLVCRALAAVVFLLAIVPAAFAQQEGTYRIMTLGNMRIWHEDAGASKKINSSGENDNDNSRFILEKQRDGNFRIKVKATDLYLHEDGGGDKLLSTRYQPADVFTQFQFVPQTDLSYRIKAVGSNRWLRDVPTAEGGTLSTTDETDDQFSRFLLLAPDARPHDKKKVTIQNGTAKQLEVFRITRAGDVVRHETGIVIAGTATSVQELNVGFRWLVRDSASGTELSRFLTLDRSDARVTILASITPPQPPLPPMPPIPSPPLPPTPMPPSPSNQKVAPRLVDMFKVDAEIALAGLGVSFRAQPGNQTADDAKLGLVYAQDIAAGTTVGANTTVTFQYYTRQMPAGVTSVKVPWIINRSRLDAEKWALRNGLIPEGYEPETAPNAISEFRVKGYNQNQTPEGDTTAAVGSVLRYRYYTGVSTKTPLDANSPDPIPNLIPYANADGSISVAWTRVDGKSFYSTYSGNNWSNATHVPLTNALRYLAGFTKDQNGVAYIATMRGEFARQEDWDAGYRPNVAHLLRLNPGASQAELFLDLNQAKYMGEPIRNPLLSDSAKYNTARLVHGNGMLALTFDMNHSGNAQSSHNKSFPILLKTDGTPLYKAGGSQHCEDLSLMFDGKDFVMGQAFEAGVGLSKLTPQGTWTDQIYAFRRMYEGAMTFNRVGGTVAMPSSYLHLVAHRANGNANYYPSESISENAATIYLGVMPREFQQLPKFDWLPGYKVPQLPTGVSVRTLASAAPGTTLVRPKIVDLQNGTAIAIWEERRTQQPIDGRWGEYLNTQAVLLDANGTVIRGPVRLEKAPTQMSNDPFNLPAFNGSRVAWISGDVANQRIMLHTLTNDLTLQSFPLSIPE